MRMQTHSLLPGMRRSAPLGVDRQGLGRLRMVMVAVTLLSVPLASCAGTGNETIADGTGATALKQPVKARTARAELSRPASSSITTASEASTGLYKSWSTATALITPCVTEV